MKNKDFNKYGHKLVDWMSNYFKEIENYPIKPNVKPGDIYKQFPSKAPLNKESFETIFNDFKNIILPGITHWQNPNFHAFFPANNSYPSVLAEMLIATLGAQCMMWDTSPSATELEERVVDWLKDELGLPTSWKGVINDTASIGTICSLLTAREIKSNFSINKSGYNTNKYTVYTSKEAHSSVEKAVKIIGLGSKNLKKIETNKDMSMNIESLESNIKQDLSTNSIPLAIISTFGTTGTVGFDSINKISLIAKKYSLWHHIDAAYAGSALLLNKYKKYIKNIHLADSFVFNPHKWMLTNFDCSIYYAKNHEALVKSLEIYPEYLKSSEKKINNYKDWSIQLGRRFRALKLWFVIRSYGIKGIKKYLKKHIKYAKNLSITIDKDKNFELTAPQNLNMINFRFYPKNKDKSNLNDINHKLIKKLNKTGKIYLSHTKIDDIVSIRMPIGSTYIKRKHIEKSWKLIKEISNSII